jgi:NADH:ubiquinone oxidoreductase subunit 4 (subunit M)
MDTFLYRFLWRPFKWIGDKFEFLTSRTALVILIAIYAFGLYSFFTDEKPSFYGYLPYAFAFLSVVLILKAFTGRGNATDSWILVFTSQFFIALSIALNKDFDLSQIAIYLSGGIIAGIIGYVCLTKIKSVDNDIDLNKFHGYAYEEPRLALIFLVCCLGLVAFPITPAFIGFDILLTHINEHQVVLIILYALCFIFIELTVLRIYARIFMGQHKKAYHAMAYRSS